MTTRAVGVGTHLYDWTGSGDDSSCFKNWCTELPDILFHSELACIFTPAQQVPY